MNTDHHFPRYHVRPPTGYVNDPNGPVFLGGRWHLYFQYTHDTPRRGAVVWGHASSSDLAHWQLHRPAMGPDPESIDRDGCWSGNTVPGGSGEGDLVAFYSGFRQGHPYQSVVAATSTDGGRSFGPPAQVVADPEPADGVVEYRDPFVWRQDDGWRMVVGAGDRSGVASTRLYASADLRSWEARGKYAELARTAGEDLDTDPDTGDMWECPQLVSFGDRDALLVGTYYFTPGGIGQVLALVGTRIGDRLTDPVASRFDVGRNFYASSAARESDAGPIVWGWVTEARDAEWAIEADWSGMISLPRSVSLTDDDRLASAPHPALAALRSDPVDPTGSAPSATAEFAALPAQFEAELTLTGHSGGEPTGLTLRCADDERLEVTVDWSTGRVTVDREHASRDPRAHGGSFGFTEPTAATDGALTLRWFVDGSVSELFTGSGRCSTVRFYPTTPPPWDLTISGLTSEDAVRVWPLRAGLTAAGR